MSKALQKRAAAGLRASAIFWVVLLISLSSLAEADGIAIISNRSVDGGGITRGQLTDLFLGRKSILGVNSQEISALDSADEVLRSMFYNQLVGMSESRLRAYWAKRVFTGRGRPPKVVSAAELAVLLAESRPFVTYVRSDAVPANAVVLFRSP